VSAQVNIANGYDDTLNNAINAVVTCKGINIEVCGNWVWLSGDTKPHRDAIKAAGFKWASKKLMWYFRPEEWSSSNRKNTSIDDIREAHGSIKVQTKYARAVT